MGLPLRIGELLAETAQQPLKEFRRAVVGVGYYGFQMVEEGEGSSVVKLAMVE